MTRHLAKFLPVLATAAIALGLAMTAACGPSLLQKKPKSASVNQAVTAMWAADVRRNAKSGDWILTRSYSAIGDAIVIGTRGEALSHASIYDAERGTAIEAVSDGIREVPLETLLARNHVVIIVRPEGMTNAERRASVRRARSVIGGDFDYAGMLGADVESKFYCTELVVWASALERDAIVITPAELMDRGRVIYFSGTRDDRQVQGAAHERARIAATRRRASLRTAALAGH